MPFYEKLNLDTLCGSKGKQEGLHLFRGRIPFVSVQPIHSGDLN